MKDYKIETLLSHHAEERADYKGAVVPPIFQNSLFTFSSLEAINEAFDDPVNNYIYTRGRNPSSAIVEEKLAKICGGEKAKLFSSGMGAISSAILHYVKSGDHIISLKNVYGPAGSFMNEYLRKKFTIESTFISGVDIEEFKASIQSNTKLIYLESPSTVIFSMQDLRAVANLAKENKIATIVDNTWASPIFQNPISLGIDMEIHSCSKYIGGHSDVIAGVIIGKEKDIDEILLTEHALFGAKIAPIESWLLMRSLRTLPIRMFKHQDSALKIAEYLEKHPRVKKVYYPALKSFPQYELGKKQMSGYSGLMSFILDTENMEDIKKFVNNLKVFQIGVGWGGHESLVYVPAISYLKQFSPEQIEGMGLSINTIRISIGLEDSQDLIEDLNSSLK